MIENWMDLLKKNTNWKKSKADSNVLNARENRLRLLMEGRKNKPRKIEESLFLYYYNCRLHREKEDAADEAIKFMAEFFPKSGDMLNSIISEVEDCISSRKEMNLLSDEEVIELLEVSEEENKKIGFGNKRKQTELGRLNQQLDQQKREELAKLYFAGMKENGKVDTNYIAEKLGWKRRKVQYVIKCLNLRSLNAIEEVDFNSCQRFRHKSKTGIDFANKKTPDWGWEREAAWVESFQYALPDSDVEGRKGIYNLIEYTLSGNKDHQERLTKCLADVASICISRPLTVVEKFEKKLIQQEGKTKEITVEVRKLDKRLMGMIDSIRIAVSKGTVELDFWRDKLPKSDGSFVIYPTEYQPFTKNFAEMVERFPQERKQDGEVIMKRLSDLQKNDSLYFEGGKKRMRREVFFQLLQQYLTPQFLLDLPRDAINDDKAFIKVLVNELSKPRPLTRVGRLSKEQRAALKVLESGQNVFITGGAGVGKTVLLNAFVEEQTKKGKKILVTAPTGMAAAHISGTTLHQAFGIPQMVMGTKEYNTKKIATIRQYDVIIIDEISICRADVFNYVTNTIDQTNKPIQLVVCGDFYQLPPVLEKDEKNTWNRKWNDIGIYAFDAPNWAKKKFKIVNLTEVHRQKNKAFIEALNKVRVGDSDGIKWINQNAHFGEILDATTIAAKNKDVNEVNQKYIDKYSNYTLYRPVNCHYLEGTHAGEACGKDVRVSGVLPLYQGMQIMFTKNMSELGVQNGTTGVITKLMPNSLYVRISNGCEVLVRRVSCQEGNIIVSNDWLDEAKGEKVTYSQFPIKPAYAYTAHKAQGQSLNLEYVIPGMFEHGQLYVALSRCKDVSRLYIQAPIDEGDLIIDERVKEFYNSLN